jgi:adenylate cyclase class IV
MAEEKEIKLKIDEDITSEQLMKILSKKLTLDHHVIQSDEYYDQENFLFTKRDRGLRVRFINGKPVDFTFKALFFFPERVPTPWYVEEHAFKLPTSEFKRVEEIFSRFNLKIQHSPKEPLTYEILHQNFLENKLSPKIVIKKDRSVFNYQDAQVILDQVEELGNFIEIETKKTTPIKIAQELNLLQYGKQTIEGYTTLLSRKFGLAEMKQKEPLYRKNPKWNIFKNEQKKYEVLNQTVK